MYDSCDVNAEFSAAITPVSHDLSENHFICWFGAQKTNLLLLSMLKTVVLHICVETMLLFVQDSLLNRKLKDLFEIYWNRNLL